MPAADLDPLAHLRDPRFWIASAITIASIHGLYALGALHPAAVFPMSFLAAVVCTLFSRWRLRHERDRNLLRCVGCGAEWQVSHPAEDDFCSMCGQTNPYPEEHA